MGTVARQRERQRRARQPAPGRLPCSPHKYFPALHINRQPPHPSAQKMGRLCRWLACRPCRHDDVVGDVAPFPVWCATDRRRARLRSPDPHLTGEQRQTPRLRRPDRRSVAAFTRRPIRIALAASDQEDDERNDEQDHENCPQQAHGRAVPLSRRLQTIRNSPTKRAGPPSSPEDGADLGNGAAGRAGPTGGG
jgi:hypothetical protein